MYNKNTVHWVILYSFSPNFLYSIHVTLLIQPSSDLWGWGIWVWKGWCFSSTNIVHTNIINWQENTNTCSFSTTFPYHEGKTSKDSLQGVKRNPTSFRALFNMSLFTCCLRNSFRLKFQTVCMVCNLQNYFSLIPSIFQGQLSFTSFILFLFYKMTSFLKF